MVDGPWPFACLTALAAGGQHGSQLRQPQPSAGLCARNGSDRQPCGRERSACEVPPSVPHPVLPETKPHVPPCIHQLSHILLKIFQFFWKSPLVVASPWHRGCCAELGAREPKESLLHPGAILFLLCLSSCVFWDNPAIHVHAHTPAKVYFSAIQPKLHPLQDTTNSSLTFKAKTQKDL